ncbi:MAG TPA: SPOR domain-containing protein, partial [Candidatus Krumholzibacteria bacterium]|nr:SPOR domain-containing protein [Candidatus Krumholzibacteria bacterium]
LMAAPARAQQGGASGASFLKIPVGARLMASPDAVAGMRPDASLLYSNPAFLGGLESSELFVSSSQWLDQISFNAFGAAIPLGPRNTVLGIGTTILYSGALQGYDASNAVVWEQSYYDLALDIALAHHFSSTGLSLAGGMTYVREHFAGSDGSGYAFNAGASYWRGRNLFHAAVRDAGGVVNFASGTWDIASEWMAGAGRVFNSGAGQFFAGIQASTSDAYGNRVRFGVDYAITPAFTLRGGFNDNLDATQAATSINAGLGMRYGAFALEYAYTPQDYFSSSHTFSLAYCFGAHTSPPGTATVPVGDLAPPVPDTRAIPPSSALPNARPTAGVTEYLLVAGSHATRASAEDEARTLEHLNILAGVEPEGPRFRVVLGHFESFQDADRVRARYRAQGHDFLIVAH